MKEFAIAVPFNRMTIGFYLRKKDYVDKRGSSFTGQLFFNEVFWGNSVIEGHIRDYSFDNGRVFGLLKKKEISHKFFWQESSDEVSKVNKITEEFKAEMKRAEERSTSGLDFVTEMLLQRSGEVWGDYLRRK